jgi:hypothetical protein
MINMMSDIIYWICKIYFSFFWLVFLASIYYKWDGGFMWWMSGIISIIYFIVNIRWYLKVPSFSD